MPALHLGKRAPLLALAASAGLALVTLTAGCGAPAHVASHHPDAPAVRLTAGQPGSAAPPRYFADIVHSSGSVAGAGLVQVRSAATGRLVQRQPDIEALAIGSLGSGSRFLIALQAGDSCTSRLYRATLSAHGTLGRLTRLGPVVRGLVTSVAADAGGSLIGYFAGPCSKSGSGYLAVLTSRTGQVRRWSGVAVYGSAGNVLTGTALSMSANGKLLAFTGATAGSGGTVRWQRVWVLRTAASPGTLTERSRVVLSRPNSGPALTAVELSPDGREFSLCAVTTKGTVSAKKTVTQTAVVTARRTSDGASTATIATLTTTGVTFAEQFAGCSLAADPGGHYLLVPYSLRYAQTTLVGPTMQVARISIAARSLTTLSVRLPGSGGMSVATGIGIAW